ncbi:hypothetical protein [Bacillus horti]|uniref:Uncharacterized protein n=1 Tax=Caldalkalibacillus horti TaxID=77523 RepID=A0ABT9W0J4_9BACI|nr:hypothetical protein [Bacillus horti]MDQ0166562.1 hypothetical protein [Bacillus horti]
MKISKWVIKSTSIQPSLKRISISNSGFIHRILNKYSNIEKSYLGHLALFFLKHLRSGSGDLTTAYHQFVQILQVLQVGEQASKIKEGYYSINQEVFIDNHSNSYSFYSDVSNTLRQTQRLMKNLSPIHSNDRAYYNHYIHSVNLNALSIKQIVMRQNKVTLENLKEIEKLSRNESFSLHLAWVHGIFSRHNLFAIKAINQFQERFLSDDRRENRWTQGENSWTIERSYEHQLNYQMNDLELIIKNINLVDDHEFIFPAHRISKAVEAIRSDRSKILALQESAVYKENSVLFKKSTDTGLNEIGSFSIETGSLFSHLDHEHSLMQVIHWKRFMRLTSTDLWRQLVLARERKLLFTQVLSLEQTEHSSLAAMSAGLEDHSSPEFKNSLEQKISYRLSRWINQANIVESIQSLRNVNRFERTGRIIWMNRQQSVRISERFKSYLIKTSHNLTSSSYWMNRLELIHSSKYLSRVNHLEEGNSRANVVRSKERKHRNDLISTIKRENRTDVIRSEESIHGTDLIKSLESKNRTERTLNDESQNRVDFLRNFASQNTVNFIRNIESQNRVDFTRNIESQNRVDFTRNFESQNRVNLTRNIESQNRVNFISNFESMNRYDYINNFKRENRVFFTSHIDSFSASKPISKKENLDISVLTRNFKLIDSLSNRAGLMNPASKVQGVLKQLYSFHQRGSLKILASLTLDGQDRLEYIPSLRNRDSLKILNSLDLNTLELIDYVEDLGSFKGVNKSKPLTMQESKREAKLRSNLASYSTSINRLELMSRGVFSNRLYRVSNLGLGTQIELLIRSNYSSSLDVALSNFESIHRIQLKYILNDEIRSRVEQKNGSVSLNRMNRLNILGLGLASRFKQIRSTTLIQRLERIFSSTFTDRSNSINRLELIRSSERIHNELLTAASLSHTTDLLLNAAARITGIKKRLNDRMIRKNREPYSFIQQASKQMLYTNSFIKENKLHILHQTNQQNLLESSLQYNSQTTSVSNRTSLGLSLGSIVSSKPANLGTLLKLNRVDHLDSLREWSGVSNIQGAMSRSFSLANKESTFESQVDVRPAELQFMSDPPDPVVHAVKQTTQQRETERSTSIETDSTNLVAIDHAKAQKLQIIEELHERVGELQGKVQHISTDHERLKIDVSENHKQTSLDLDSPDFNLEEFIDRIYVQLEKKFEFERQRRGLF